MTVKEIVKKYLEENGFDGLYDPGECACKIDDLFSCGCPEYCEPGYLVKADLSSGYDFMIGPKKEES